MKYLLCSHMVTAHASMPSESTMTNLCASTNNSPTLPSVHIYSVPKMLSIRTLQPVLPSSSSGAHKFGLSLVSEDSLTIVAAKAVAMANAAAQAAREAMILHCEENKFECENDEIMESCDMRRVSAGTWRKRRKRREEKFPCNELNSVGKILQFPLRKSRSARLTPNEEAEFTLHLKEGARLDAAKTRARETSQCAFTSSQWDASTGMKRRKLEMIMCKARESRERIISSYRRLVVSIANGYQGKGLRLEDLIQEGSIGLLRGAKKFEPNKGFKLSTYAYWWIKQAIIRAIANKSRIIRLSGSMCEMVPKIVEANKELTRRLGRNPTNDEIADSIGIKVSSIALLQKRNRPPISLDQSHQTLTECMTMQGIMPGPEELRPENMLKTKVIKKKVDRLLMTLDSREALIMRLYFGLNGETTRSCEEIGMILNLSRERVRQIHGIALAKLRRTNNIDNILTVHIE